MPVCSPNDLVYEYTHLLEVVHGRMLPEHVRACVLGLVTHEARPRLVVVVERLTDLHLRETRVATLREGYVIFHQGVVSIQGVTLEGGIYLTSISNLINILPLI